MAAPFLNVTAPADVDVSIPEIWAKLILRDQLYSGFFKDFVGGEGSGKPIIQLTELLNKPGDTIHVSTSSPLAGAGVSGDTATLIGSEEKLSLSDIVTIPTLFRHAIAVNRRANKKSIQDLRSEGRLRLAEWGGQKMDTVRIANFVQTANLNGAVYTPNITVVNGGATVDDVAAADTLTVAEIQTIKLKLYTQRAKPMIVNGKPVYAMLCHPNSLFDLKRESEYRDWVRVAAVQGAENPFFQGATAMIDGMVLFEHPNVATVVNAGAVKTSKNIAFGAEAFVEGVDEDVSFDEELYDYGMQYGVSYSFAFQPRRGLEQNSIQVYAAAVDK